MDEILTPTPEQLKVDPEWQKKLERFFALAGIFKDDPEFDAAMEYLDRAWKQWTPPDFS